MQRIKTQFDLQTLSIIEAMAAEQSISKSAAVRHLVEAALYQKSAEISERSAEKELELRKKELQATTLSTLILKELCTKNGIDFEPLRQRAAAIAGELISDAFGGEK